MQDKSARADGVRKTSVYLTPRPYIYLHRRADTGAVFYVGAGSGYRARSKASRNEDWSAVAAACGLTVQIIDTFDTPKEAGEAEREVIDLLTSMGVVLANRGPGGEGCGHRTMAEWEAKAAVQDAVALVGKMGRERMLREAVERWRATVLRNYLPPQRRGEPDQAYRRRLGSWRRRVGASPLPRVSRGDGNQALHLA